MELETPKKTTRQKVSSVLNATLPYIIIVIVVALIRTFIITPVQVEGMSMYSTLDDKEILLLKKYDKSYDRFDVVVFNYNNTKLIKRVVGLPGDTVKYKDNKLYINGKYIKEEFLKNNQETSNTQKEIRSCRRIRPDRNRLSALLRARRATPVPNRAVRPQPSCFSSPRCLEDRLGS